MCAYVIVKPPWVYFWWLKAVSCCRGKRGGGAELRLSAYLPLTGGLPQPTHIPTNTHINTHISRGSSFSNAFSCSKIHTAVDELGSECVFLSA